VTFKGGPLLEDSFKHHLIPLMGHRRNWRGLRSYRWTAKEMAIVSDIPRGPTADFSLDLIVHVPGRDVMFSVPALPQELHQLLISIQHTEKR